MARVMPHTVLAVDDELEIVESLRRALRGEPYRFIATTSAREARDIVDRGGIDLIIADIDMPELSGLELVAHVRRTKPEVIRILLTGDSSLESALDAINRSEVHRYFTKPWRNEPLRTSIREALARLDEVRRSADADQAVRVRDHLCQELELAHPGISRSLPMHGIHELDVVHLRTVLERLDLPALEPLLKTSPDASTWNEHTTAIEGGER